MPDSPKKLLDPLPSEKDSEIKSRFRWWRRYGVAWLLTLVFVYSLGVWNGWQRPATAAGQTPIRIAFGQGLLIVQTIDYPVPSQWGIGPLQLSLGEMYKVRPEGTHQVVRGWWPFNTWIRWNPRRYGTLWLSPACYRGYVRIPIVWLPILAWSWIGLQTWRRQRKPSRGQCPHCRYDTRGLPTNLCPECGRRIDE